MASAETRSKPGPGPKPGLKPGSKHGPTLAPGPKAAAPLICSLKQEQRSETAPGLQPKPSLKYGKEQELKLGLIPGQKLGLNQRLQSILDPNMGLRGPTSGVKPGLNSFPKVDYKLAPNRGLQPNRTPKLELGPQLDPNRRPKACQELGTEDELSLGQNPELESGVPGQRVESEQVLTVGLQSQQKTGPNHYQKQRLIHELQPKTGHHLDPPPGRNAVLHIGSKDGPRRDQKLALNPDSNGCPKVEQMSVVNPGLEQELNQTFGQKTDLGPGLKPRTLSNPQPQTSSTSCLKSNFKLLPSVFLLLLFLLTSFVNLTQAGPPRPARPPLLSGQPFIVFWGVKDTSCLNRPDLRSFGIEPEGRVAVFYEDTLGNYPYLVDKDTPVNGGLPQHTKLDLHIQKTQGDVEAALPAPRYLGLGVVRWSEWAPQWSRSGGKQGLYLEATRKLLRSFFPDWTPQEVERWSKVDFEAAAQSVMTETLREVQRSRPKALWGISPYPSCSNGTPAQTSLSNYTGECPEEERSLNDQLLWLWKRSTAIYPLLTLEKIQGGTPGAALFLSNQIRESLRVSSLGGGTDDLPVFPMVRSVYASTNTFLSLSDLVSTIGESAALGTAGVIVWDRTETKTERECEDLRTFTSSVLGPYVSNVTAASRLCSASLCQSRGRCVRLDQDKPAFLHLPPANNAPTEKPDAVKPSDQPDPVPRPPPEPDPAELWKKDFQCQWFSSADGDASDQQSPKDGAPSVGSGEDGAGRSLDVLATVSNLLSTTTGAYEGQDRGGNGGSVSPEMTLETPRDKGDGPKSAPRTTIIIITLLLLALCL